MAKATTITKTAHERYVAEQNREYYAGFKGHTVTGVLSLRSRKADEQGFYKFQNHVSVEGGQYVFDSYSHPSEVQL